MMTMTTAKKLKILKETQGSWKHRKDIKDVVSWTSQLRKKSSTRAKSSSSVQ